PLRPLRIVNSLYLQRCSDSWQRHPQKGEKRRHTRERSHRHSFLSYQAKGAQIVPSRSFQRRVEPLNGVPKAKKADGGVLSTRTGMTHWAEKALRRAGKLFDNAAFLASGRDGSNCGSVAERGQSLICPATCHSSCA